VSSTPKRPLDLSPLLHDRSLSSVARDESRMAGGEPRMTGDYCLPEESILGCVRTHSHLYSYIYGLVALLDNIQLSFSKYHYLNNIVACEFQHHLNSWMRM
jgi:hypothetical protein